MTEDIPDVIYKYLPDEGGLDIITSLRLKVTFPREMNDPFECLPSISTEELEERMELYFKSPRFSADLSLKNMTHRRHAVVASKRKEFQDITEDVRKSALPEVGNMFPIACFSTRWDGILMWSHYARHHTGFVIGFRSSELLRTLKHPGLVRVKYSKDRPRINDGFLDSTPNAGEVFTQSLRTKSKEWHYEQEVRLIVSAERETIVEENGCRYIPISSSAIETLIVGCRGSRELSEEIKRSVRQSRQLRHITIRKAKCDESEFKLVLSSRSSRPAREKSKRPG